MINFYKKVWNLLSKKDRKKSVFLLFLMIISSIFELVGLGVILPFLSIVGNPNIIKTNHYLNLLYNYYSFNKVADFILFIGILSFIAVLVSSLIKILTSFLQHRFVNFRRFSISDRLIRKYFQQNYSFFIDRNSSDLIKIILSEVDIITSQIILPGFNLIKNSITLILLSCFLIFTDPSLAIIVSLTFGSFYFLLFSFVKKKLNSIGEQRLLSNDLRFKILTESIGGIKEIKLLGKESLFTKRFNKQSYKYSHYTSLSQIFSDLPQFIIEIITYAIILSVTLFYVAFEDNVLENILPILGLYAISFIKIKPAFNSIYSALTKIKYGTPALNNLIKELSFDEVTQENNLLCESLQFNKVIDLISINHFYKDSKKPSLRDVTIKIPKYSTVGIIGESGAGKSTLIDILLGLLKPHSGKILIDNKKISESNIRSWQNLIGYVPQSIFLFDDTIASNIAIGSNEGDINFDHIIKVSKMANAHDFIIKLKNGYYTKIGERGIRLSGGQKQRLAIARALYNNPELLVFDEATSALDQKTENQVMKSIKNIIGTKTIIIISHNLKTLENCDKIYCINNGELTSFVKK